MLMVLKKYLTSQPHRRDRFWLCQYSGSCRYLVLNSYLSTGMQLVLKKYLTSQPHRRDRLWLCQYSGSCR
jgi:hypothetical protein